MIPQVSSCLLYTSTYFPRMSPIPESERTEGASHNTSGSAKSATGALAGTVSFCPFIVMAAIDDAKPSTLAAVGNDLRGSPSSAALYRVISCIEPDPQAINTPDFSFSILLLERAAASGVACCLSG